MKLMSLTVKLSCIVLLLFTGIQSSWGSGDVAEPSAKKGGITQSAEIGKIRFKVGVQSYRKGDYDVAYKELLPIAQQGNARAQYYIAKILLKTRRMRSAEENIAYYDFLSKSANGGYAAAQIMLARESFVKLENSSEDGKKYIIKDKNEALRLAKKAADQNNVEALNFLGDEYRRGKNVKKDMEKAIQFYERAAQQGSHWAAIMVRDLYAERKDEKSAINAAFWCYVALNASVDYQVVGTSRAYYQESIECDNLVNKLSKKSLKLLSTREEEWKPRPEDEAFLEEIEPVADSKYIDEERGGLGFSDKRVIEYFASKKRAAQKNSLGK